MKPWPLLIGIVVILAMFCTPAIAISKSDLISQYKAGGSSGSTPPTSTPTPHIPSWYITPTPAPGFGPILPSPTPTPTQVPTGSGTTGTLLVTSNPTGATVYLDGVYKGVTPEPVPYTGSGIYIRGTIREGNGLSLTGISAGSHQLRITKEGYLDYRTSVIVTGGETTSVRADLVSTPSWNSPVAIPPKTWSLPSKEELVAPYSGSQWSYPVFNDFSQDLPPKGKPNIYLYNDRDINAQVRLAPEYAITVSDPVYQPGKGWRAEIRNGSLNGNGDFLFYEALGSDFPWQKEEGYVIRAAYRGQDMAFMLGQYGFNEKETREFIEYWSSHLVEDVDFVFYPQETAAVNQDMPLYIRPKPDHVMRIWFSAEPLGSVPDAVTDPETIVREGFYIVEWGVIIDDGYKSHSSP